MNHTQLKAAINRLHAHHACLENAIVQIETANMTDLEKQCRQNMELEQLHVTTRIHELKAMLEVTKMAPGEVPCSNCGKTGKPDVDPPDSKGRQNLYCAFCSEHFGFIPPVDASQEKKSP